MFNYKDSEDLLLLARENMNLHLLEVCEQQSQRWHKGPCLQMVAGHNLSDSFELCFRVLY